MLVILQFKSICNETAEKKAYSDLTAVTSEGRKNQN